MTPVPFEKNSGHKDRIERHDCAVRALTIAGQIPYAEAHQACRNAGRKDGCGFNNLKFAQVLHARGFAWRPSFKSRRLCDAIQDMKKGRYVIYVRGHFFAVVDGVVEDNFPQHPIRKIKWCYQAPELY